MIRLPTASLTDGLRATIAIAIASGLLLSGALPHDQASAQAPEGRLDSHLEALVQELRGPDPAGAMSSAQDLGINTGPNEVRVIIEASDADAVPLHDLSAAGATVELRHDGLLQARVALHDLEPLASVAGVDLVRVPLRAVPLVTSQGVALTNADDWHAAGLSGSGVNVAIVDLGFAGYTSKLGTELPASVTAMSFRADGDIGGGGQPHGTAVAEVVHDMAPGAELFLVNFNTEVELAAATDWLSGQQIDIVNASWGYFASGPGDGTGVVNEIVSGSVADGIFWSVAAGNHAQRHWAGAFTDVDADTFHEFTTGATPDEGNEIGFLFAGAQVAAELKWDDPFGAACRDYDLFLMRTEGPQLVTVASSQNIQHNAGGCVPGADPTEGFIVVAPVTDNYHLVVKESFAESDATIELFTWAHDLEYRVVPGTILQPGDNPNVTTVGAVPASVPTAIETFSSRGPTRDLRIKPDIAAPDAVTNSVYGTFAGTSAASPHVAGAAALAAEALPCFGPAQMGAYLETQVVDLGAAGKDNTFGAGRLNLGAPPGDLDGDNIADGCDPNADGDIFLDATEMACGVVSLGPSVIPERTDGAFASVDDDGDTQVDEALPVSATGLDCDGDGYTGTAESSIFAPAAGRDQDACGTEAWPSDLFPGGPSEHKLDVQDIISFIAPIRILDSSPNDPEFDPRWDLLPGSQTFSQHINIQDITTMLSGITGSPPMFVGLRAFNKSCPWP